jgi:hypothetical protein
VGQFRQLLTLAEARGLSDQLRVVMKSNEGWKTACEHAQMAVDVDNNLRVWWTNELQVAGLLFEPREGSPVLGTPRGEPLPSLRCRVGLTTLNLL